MGRHVCGIDPPSPHLLLIAGVLGSSSYMREEAWGISPFRSGEAANYESMSSYETTRVSDSGRKHTALKQICYGWKQKITHTYMTAFHNRWSAS